MVYEIFAGIFFIISLVLWGTAFVAFTRYSESPSVDMFGVVAGTLGAGGLLISYGFAVSEPVIVLGVTIAINMLIPIPWIMFSFDYTGKEKLVSTRTASALAIPIIFGLSATIAIFASQALPWLTYLTQDGETGMVAVVITVLQLSQWGGFLYAGGLVLAGTGLILWTFHRYTHLDNTTGTVLCTFGTIPWVSVLFGLQLESLSFFVFSGTVATGFSIGAIAAVGLVGPSSLFDRVPAAGNVGPTTVIDELEDAVVITDGDGQIIDLNPSARRLFEQDGDVVKSHIDDPFDTTLEELRDGQLIQIESEFGQTLFDPTVSELTDQHGRLLGYAIVLRDVTGRTIRKQRLEVLNRLLRHTLRNDMTVILGRTEVLRENIEDPSTLEDLESIVETGERLIELSEKVRDSAQILAFDRETTHRIPIESLVRQEFEGVNSDPTVEFRYQGPDEISIGATRDELRVALENLIQNAIQHNDTQDCQVSVEVTHYPEERYPLEIAVLDDGPGIPEPERNVIETGTETALEHSSGVGLWTVHWIMRSLGGKVSFDNRETGGSVVTLSFPTGQLSDTGEEDSAFDSSEEDR